MAIILGRMGGRTKGALWLCALAALCALASSGLALADVVSGGNATVSFGGWISPRKLPRSAAAPITLHVAGTVRPIADRRPDALKRVKVELNRNGVLSTRGLPTCPRRRLEGTTSAQARQACPGALVGVGRFRAHVEIPEGAPFPSIGRMLAFNSTLHGHPALLAHVYGTDPVPTSQVVPISLGRHGEDGFGSTLSVLMPEVGREWGYVTGFAMTFHRLYAYRGHTHSFLAASCPAPAGIVAAPFRAARGTYYLADGRVLTRVVSGSCRVRGD